MDSLMYSVLRLIDEVDFLASLISPTGKKIFGSTSLRYPKLTPAELGFLRTVSWLYVLYYEVGKVNVKFLMDRFDAYGLDLGGMHSEHFHAVHHLRTYLQHNLDPVSIHDRDILETCHRWFKSHCDLSIPESEDHWQKCLSGMIDNVLAFLSVLKNCIRKIEDDDSKEEILEDWEFRRNRYHSPSDFVTLIDIVAADMGRDKLDSQVFCRKFYDKWMKELSLFTGKYDFGTEARKLVEREMLSESEPILPLNGEDIMKTFNIPPGPRVGEFLRAARSFYVSNPCNHDKLLEKLRSHFITHAANGPSAI